MQTVCATSLRKERLTRAGFLASSRELSGENVSGPPVGKDRDDLVETVAAYLAYLAREFPVKDPRAGAELGELFACLQRETAKLFGGSAASLLAHWNASLPAIAEASRRVAVDGRLHRSEWRKIADGGWIKADAFDSVGAQDIAWDIAGATIELGLDDDERNRVLFRLAREADYRADTAMLAFHELAYLAFHAERREAPERQRYTDKLSLALRVSRWQLRPREVTDSHGVP